MSVLVLDSVSRTRGKGVHAVRALRNASLMLESGEVVLLEGPSGAGKTTLLAVAAGLLLPDTGNVHLCDRSLIDLSQAERRSLRASRVGFVFQRANLLGRISVRENVLLMGVLAGLPPQTAALAAHEILSALGMGVLADRRSDELSGGEEQRVAVARALVHRPALVLADEPTGSLDWDTARPVITALTALVRDREAALVIATHDERLRPFASRRMRIRDGQLENAPGSS